MNTYRNIEVIEEEVGMWFELANYGRLLGYSVDLILCGRHGDDVEEDERGGDAIRTL